jgi:cytoskeletal protein CcmA (bactofilin family)
MANIEKNQAQIKQTTVEEGTEFKGTLHSRCEVVVRGVVDGDLVAPSVVVSETGTVIGNVKADCIRSEGVLAGHVDADDVYLSGSVRSDTVIRAKSLEVKLHGHKLEVTFGACVLEVGDDPAREAQDAPKTQAQLAVQPSAPEREAVLMPANKRRRSVPPPPDAIAALEPADDVNGRAGDETGGSDRRSVPPPS